MKLGYWETPGGQPMKTHTIDGDRTPACRHPEVHDRNLVTWYGDGYGTVDCHNCLRVLRARRRRDIRAIERRLAGKDAAQVDALL